MAKILKQDYSYNYLPRTIW